MFVQAVVLLACGWIINGNCNEWAGILVMPIIKLKFSHENRCARFLCLVIPSFSDRHSLGVHAIQRPAQNQDPLTIHILMLLGKIGLR